jgi:hypothetical protein
MATKTPETIQVFGMTFQVVRKSKWTVEAWANNEKCASDKSMPKLITKLEGMFKPPVVEEVKPPVVEEVKPPVVEEVKPPVVEEVKPKRTKRTKKKSAPVEEKPKRVKKTRRSKKKKEVKTGAGAKKPKSGGLTVKSLVLEYITNGDDDDTIINKVKNRIPDSRIDKSHTSWYRSTLVSAGVIDPIFAPRQSRVYKNAKKKLDAAAAKS